MAVPRPSGHDAAPTPEDEVASSPPRCVAACSGDDASARVVLWALVRSASSRQRHHPPLDCGAEHAARAGANSGGGGGGGRRGSATTAPPSWQFREGVLLVYEGVLKHLLEVRLAEALSSGDGGNPCPTSARGGNGDDSDGFIGEWPAELLHGTPPVGELLPLLLSQAQHALYAAELMRSAASHPQQEHQPGAGLLELWRSGSQLLPTIARAMVWWNPRAIFR